jgi:hypothetical protein
VKLTHTRIQKRREGKFNDEVITQGGSEGEAHLSGVAAKPFNPVWVVTGGLNGVTNSRKETRALLLVCY